jgi:2-keto-4-pentenoate hydratase
MPSNDADRRRDPWEIPAVVAGMEKLLVRRAEMLAAGATPIGWKLAFGTPVAMESLGTTGPLVGFLTDRTLIASGGECSIGGWAAPKLEPEIAVHFGAGGQGVAGVSAAIELADADRPPTETEAVLAGDIFHRAVVLDLGAAGPVPVRPIEARIERDGEEIAATDDGESATGKLEDLAAYVVRYLGEFGESTAEGEVIICGSMVGLLDIAAGQHLTNEVTAVGGVSVHIRG